MKSKVYKLDGKMFRYNFDRNTVEYVAKAGNRCMWLVWGHGG